MRQANEDQFSREDEIMENFLLEVDSGSKSINHVTVLKYRLALNDFWKILANKRFKCMIKDLNKLQLRQIRNEMQNKPISQLIDSEKRKSLNKPYEPTSIINYFSILSAYFEFLKQEKIIENNPIKEINLPSKPERNCIFLLDEEIEKLANDLIMQKKENKYYQNIMIVLLPLISGLRVIETSNLNLKDINSESGSIKIIGKGNKERVSFLPINDKLFMGLWKSFLNEREIRIDALKKLFQEKIIKKKEQYLAREALLLQNNALFINERGKRLSIRDIQRKVKSYRELFNMAKKITPHKLRHSFASKLVREHIDIFDIQKLLGHANITTTQIYLHSNEDILKKNMQEKNPFQFKFSTQT